MGVGWGAGAWLAAGRHSGGDAAGVGRIPTPERDLVLASDMNTGLVVGAQVA
jgi:hypothetical protein